MTIPRVYRPEKLPRWCRAGVHWLTTSSDLRRAGTGLGCQPCRREFVLRRMGSRPCWVCEQYAVARAGGGTFGATAATVRAARAAGMCVRCYDELALIDHLLKAIAKERQPLLTHCPAGHPYDAANTKVWIQTHPPKISRHCRACDRDNQRRYHQQRKVRAFREIVTEAAHAA